VLTREFKSSRTALNPQPPETQKNFSAPPNPKKFFRFVNRVMINPIKDTGRNMNFLKIGSVATQPIDFFTIPADMWQRYKDTQYISLRTEGFKPLFRKDVLDNLCHQCPATANTILYALEQVADLLKGCSMRKLGTARLEKLEAGGRVDEIGSPNYYHRAYLPLKAEPEVLTTCDGATRYLPVGELYTFNHDKPHSIVNGSNRDYIYLLVDYA
jgi:Aspartyl/Asparaginyl beta-hydroxylase